MILILSYIALFLIDATTAIPTVAQTDGTTDAPTDACTQLGCLNNSTCEVQANGDAVCR